jgi:3-hydroxybutyryl-CoA dehydratase
MIDKPFDEIAIGDRALSRGRTITETDVVNFCMLTGNWLELHANVEFAKATRFGQRVAQGSLVFSIVNALVPFNPDVVEAFYGVDKLRFRKPTFIGDTLHSEAEVIRLEPRGEAHGVTTVLLQAINQRSEVVMSCEFSLLVRKHPREMDIVAPRR